jgi:gag-polypeptide of LTR copia-type
MSGIPSLTILSEEQKFNGENLLQWKTNIIQLLGSKGLSGYIDGKIEKPTQPEPPKSTSEVTTATTPVTTPIYSSNPTLDEWIFRDLSERTYHPQLRRCCEPWCKYIRNSEGRLGVDPGGVGEKYRHEAIPCPGSP